MHPNKASNALTASQLIILESCLDLDALSEEHLDDSILLVATTPAVALALERRTWPYVTTQVWSEEGELNTAQFGSESDEMVDALCSAIDDALKAKFPVLAPVKPMESFFWPINLALDNALIVLSELSNMIESVRPDTIMVVAGAPTGGASGLHFQTGDRLYGDAAKLLARKYSIKIRIIAPVTLRSEKISKRNWRDTLLKCALVVQQRRLGEMARRAFRRWRKPITSARDPSILVLQSICAPTEWRKAGLHAWQWRDGAEQIREIETDRALAVPFLAPEQIIITEDDAKAVLDCATKDAEQFRGVDWIELVREHLIYCLTQRVPNFWNEFRLAQQVLTRLNCRAVIVRNLSTPFLYAVTTAARNLAIPIVGTPHGHLGDVIDPIWKWYEWRFCDHYLVHSKAGADFVDADKPSHLQTHVTGNPYLSEVTARQLPPWLVRLAYGINLTKPIIVFVTLPPHGLKRRLDSTTIENHQHFEIQKRILLTLANQNRYHILVKGLAGDTPENAPLMSIIKGLGRSDITYVNDSTFRTFLDTGSAFVLDWPSFSLLETFTRQRKIYAFNNTYQWTAEARGMLKCEIIFESDLELFCNKLHADLADGSILAPRSGSGEFLQFYGDQYGDGRSGRRAAEAILNVTRASIR